MSLLWSCHSPLSGPAHNYIRGALKKQVNISRLIWIKVFQINGLAIFTLERCNLLAVIVVEINAREVPRFQNGFYHYRARGRGIGDEAHIRSVRLPDLQDYWTAPSFQSATVPF